jgi:hypothetical protein
MNTPSGTVSVSPSTYRSVDVTVISPPGVSSASHRFCRFGIVSDSCRRTLARELTETDPSVMGRRVAVPVIRSRWVAETTLVCGSRSASK